MAKFIVVTKSGVDHTAYKAFLTGQGVNILVDFDALTRHYELEMNHAQRVAVEGHASTLLVESAEREISIMATYPINVASNGYGGNWGLARISSRAWNDLNWYPFTGAYTTLMSGSGVDAYVVDTGCRLTHSEFGGRVSILFDYFVAQGQAGYGVDTVGHGTHVCSIIGGANYGVAKDVAIKVVKVFQGSTTTLSAVIAGVNACLAHHNQKKAANSNRPSVLNLSLGGPGNSAEDLAVNDCIDAGIICVAAAGNDGQDLNAPGYDLTPAEVLRAITVGSVDIQDKISYFSNYGSIVDVFAPGHYICAAGIASDSAQMMYSGTSMAAPHVTGIVAMYLQSLGRITTNASDVATVHNWIVGNGTTDTITMIGKLRNAGTPDLMAFSDFLTSTTPTPVSGGGGGNPGGSPPRVKKNWKAKIAPSSKKGIKMYAIISRLQSSNVHSRNIDSQIDDLEYLIGEFIFASKRIDAQAIFRAIRSKVNETKSMIADEPVVFFNRLLEE